MPERVSSPPPWSEQQLHHLRHPRPADSLSPRNLSLICHIPSIELPPPFGRLPDELNDPWRLGSLRRLLPDLRVAAARRERAHYLAGRHQPTQATDVAVLEGAIASLMPCIHDSQHPNRIFVNRLELD